MTTSNDRSAGWLQTVGAVFAVIGLISFFAEQSAIGICMAVVGLALFASGVAAARKKATGSDSSTGQRPVEADGDRAEPS